MGDQVRAAALDREPGVHLGRAAYAMAARGERTERFERAVAAEQENGRLAGLRAALRDALRDLERQLNQLLETGQRAVERLRSRPGPERSGPERSR